jgi:hypothetical protein
MKSKKNCPQNNTNCTLKKYIILPKVPPPQVMCFHPKAIGATQKLPSDWKLQGLQMAQRITYLAKAYSIPLKILINIDQIGNHFVPIGGIQTCIKKGSKHVLKDKWQFTIAVSSSAIGNLLPF